MRPQPWYPPIEPSPAEAAVKRRVKSVTLFVFLRENRHEIFDEGFQEELGTLYGESCLGQPPVAPAKLALQPSCKPTRVPPTKRPWKRW